MKILTEPLSLTDSFKEMAGPLRCPQQIGSEINKCLSLSGVAHGLPP